MQQHLGHLYHFCLKIWRFSKTLRMGVSLLLCLSIVIFGRLTVGHTKHRLRGRKIQSGEKFFSKKKCNCTIVRHDLEGRLIVVKKFFCNLTPSYGAKQGQFQDQL